ncbi:SDR family NAD(P)-dependent oxidoreductase [Streptomyces sp. NPDC007851]|uniref:SDR family NAD(P)-dependent oxidoreductase n=1 Tax=Streptomyces sp. NPDC007851 TaxID=3155008 RepID=UPI003402E22D
MAATDRSGPAGLSALVTGGSRGLGLLMAARLLERGYRVTVLARDAGELDRAVAWALDRTGRSPQPVVCDVRDEPAVTAAVRETAERAGGLDLVIANAGVIQVAPAETAGTQAFRDAMGTIFEGTLHTALAALPYLRRSPAGGRLGLVGSVGGLLAVPHLVAYSCAKAAVRALGEGLQEETAGSAVSVTTVHPGLMRTGSHLQAEFGGRPEAEFAWFSALSGMPLLSMDAERAAAKVVRAVERRRTRLVLTPVARAASFAHAVVPSLVTRASGLVARALPMPFDDTAGRAAERSPMRQGHDLEAAPAAPAWARALRRAGSALNDRAAHRYNQSWAGPPTSSR